MITQSETIFEIFENNGIRNKSSLYVDDFGKKFKCPKPYIPHYHERIFGKGHGKSRLAIHIDYNGLQVSYAGTPLTLTYKEISPIKLRSIIAFFNCSKTKQETIMRHFTKIEDIGMMYEMYLKRGLKPIRPLDNSFGKIYESISLPENK